MRAGPIRCWCEWIFDAIFAFLFLNLLCFINDQLFCTDVVIWSYTTVPVTGVVVVVVAAAAAAAAESTCCWWCVSVVGLAILWTPERERFFVWGKWTYLTRFLLHFSSVTPLTTDMFNFYAPRHRWGMKRCRIPSVDPSVSLTWAS